MAQHRDLAWMTTTTTGTGTITLGSAMSGYLTFAQAGAADGDRVPYSIRDGANSEVGIGTYATSGTTLARTIVLSSTNSNAAISLSGGATVFITAIAESIPPTGETERLLIFGDSISAGNVNISAGNFWYGAGYVTWANAMSGQRFYLDVNLDKAVGGDTTALMLARYSTDVIANRTLFDRMNLNCGTNDVVGGVSLATITTNIKSIINMTLDLGKTVDIVAITPRTDTTTNQNHLIAALNCVIEDYARRMPGLIFYDPRRRFIDPTSATGAPLTTPQVLNDIVHPTAYGYWLIALEWWSSIQRFKAASPCVFADPLDVYDATFNPYGNVVGNPRLTGTTGTTGSITGTVPDSWTFSKFSGTLAASTITGSAEVNTDGTTGSRMVLTSGPVTGGTSAEGCQIFWTATLTATTLTVGMLVWGGIELEIPAACVGVTTLSLRLRLCDGSFASISELYCQLAANYLGPVTGKFTLRTPTVPIPVGTVNIVLIGEWTYDATVSASYQFKWSAPQFRQAVPYP